MKTPLQGLSAASLEVGGARVKKKRDFYPSPPLPTAMAQVTPGVCVCVGGQNGIDLPFFQCFVC